MQLIIGAVFAGIAFALSPGVCWAGGRPPDIAAIGGATQDIGTDGVYVTTLDSKRQAAFAGIQSMCWSIGPVLAGGFLVKLVGILAGEGNAVAPKPNDYANAWFFVFLGLGILLLLVAAWHSMMLPPGAKAKDAPSSFGDAMSTFGKVFVAFFQKKDVLRLLAFAFFYRFGLGLLDKIGPLFLLDSRANGGLGLNNDVLGTLNIVATAAFIGGSVVGGLFVAKVGLKKALLPLVLCLNVPNATFLYLGMARPTSVWIIGAIFLLEKLGWGIGAVGHMVYMMQQIAPGPYKTAHYAFATGIGLSLCMTLTGMVSGYIQTATGYQMFFVIVLICAVPSILATLFAPFNYADDSGKAKA